MRYDYNPLTGQLEKVAEAGDLDISALDAATEPLADEDQLLVRQGSGNKRVDVGVVRGELAADVEAAEASALAASQSAATARDQAEAARDSAIIQAGLYDDEPTGRAAVADGQTFRVKGLEKVAAYEYRRLSATASRLVAVYPSARFVGSAQQNLDQLILELVDGGKQIYTGDGPVYPIVVDQIGNVILGYNEETARLIAQGLVSQGNLADEVGLRVLPDLGIANYIGSGPIYPIATDQNNLLIYGFDRVSRTVVGLGLVNKDTLGDAGVRNYTGDGPVYPMLADQNNNVILGYDADSGSLVGSAVQNLQGGTTTVTTGSELAEPPIEKAINHFLFYGQSLSIGAAAGSVISTTQPYQNITFQGGPRAYTGTAFSWAPFKPLVEDANNAPDGGTNRRETTCSGAANYATRLMAIENGVKPSDHVILASAAGDGGEPITDLDKDAPWYTNVFLQHVVQAKALESDYAVHAIGWLQGENDNVAPVTLMSAYKSLLQQLQIDAETDIKAITGQQSPVYFITYQTCTNTRQNVQTMAIPQLELAQKSPKFFLSTPLYHIQHATDQVHLTAAGYKHVGAYFGRAYKQLVIDKRAPEWLNPLSAFLIDGVVRVRFDVPTLPLVLDTVGLAATTDYGFRLVDGNGTLPIDTITIDGSEVVITPTTAPTGAVQVRYARDYLGTGLSISGGASGNLRDSTPDTTTILGVVRPLYHVCPHFQLDVIAIED